MKKMANNDLTGVGKLRRRLRGLLKTKARSGKKARPTATARKLNTEQETHRLALEAQTELLNHAQLETEAGLARYEDLYDFAPVGYITLHSSGEIILGNIACARLLGCEQDQLLGQRLGDLVVKGNQSVFAEFLEAVFATHQHQTCELMLTHQGRISRTVQIEATHAPGDRECHAVMMDITALKHAALLTQTQGISQVGSWEYDMSSGITLWTQEVYAIHEVDCDYDPSNVELPIAFYTPQDRAQITHALQRAIEWGEPYVLELPFVGARGTHKWVRASGQAEHVDGRVLRVFGNIIDITKRKQAELDRAASAAFAKSTLDAVNEQIAVLDPHGVIFSVNQAWRDFYDNSPKQTKNFNYFIGTNYLTLCKQATGADAYSAAQMAQGIFAVMQGERDSFSMEYACHSPTEQRWFIAKVSRFQDDSGNIVVVHENITERKLAEAKLQTSHDLITKLSAQVPGMLYQFRTCPDGGMHFPYVSDGVQDLYELTPQEARGDAAPLFSIVHPDDLNRLMASIQESAATMQPWLLDFRVNLPHQGLRWHSGFSRPERLDDGSTLWHGFICDTTNRRAMQVALQASEDRFRLAMEANRDGLWDWNITDNSCYFSPACYRMLGYLPNEIPMTSEGWSDLIHPDDLERVNAVKRDCIENRIDGIDLDYRMRTKSGSWTWIQERGQAVLRDAQHRALRIIGTHADITQRRQSKESLRAALHEAERANNAKSRFLAAASHDLRQPLSALGLYVEVLKIGKKVPDEALLGKITKCTAALNELLIDLLDISKLEAGEVRPEGSNFSVFDLMANLVAIHTPEAIRKGLQMRFVPSDLHAHTDSAMFTRVLGNFISNAIRYTPYGGVLIGCRRHQGKTWVEVWDTGIGIPKNKTVEIFEEYRQLRPSENTQGERIGSGLGLAIAAKSAALLGLTIRVQSRQGKGSMFAIELPVVNLPTPTARRQALRAACRIALIDDNVNLLDALGRALEGKGHQVISANNAPALLKLLGDQVPDCIISDYRLLNDGSGLEVISTIRKALGQDIPALIITGDTDPQLIRTMAAKGISVQHKPLDFKVLQDQIAKLVNQES